MKNKTTKRTKKTRKNKMPYRCSICLSICLPLHATSLRVDSTEGIQRDCHSPSGFLNTLKHPGGKKEKKKKRRRKPESLSLESDQNKTENSEPELMPRTQPTSPHPGPGPETCYLPTPTQLLGREMCFKRYTLRKAWSGQTTQMREAQEWRWKMMEREAWPKVWAAPEKMNCGVKSSDN